MTRSKFILNLAISLVFFPLVILLAAGDWGWLEGWIFSLWFSAMVLSILIYLYLKDPALLAERSKAPGSENQKTWDAYLLTGLYLVMIAWFVIMPLDAKRFGWSPLFPAWVKILGFAALIPALYLLYFTTVQNTYLSTLVRIQGERHQKVISTGVYGFVRHPLYLGALLMFLGAPLLLGSLWGLILGLIGTAGVAVRIMGEEKMLAEELEGYEEYRLKVKYRLIPFIW